MGSNLEAIQACNGVEKVTINLENGQTIINGKSIDEQEIILADLNDADLILQMHDDLYDGLKEEIEEGVNIFLERKWQPYDILTKV